MARKFDLPLYFDTIKYDITKVLARPNRQQMPLDILDCDNDLIQAMNALQIKQKQMKFGEIWQIAIGEYDTFCNLKVGHVTGLDVMSHSRKVVIEIKNRYNTDNASARKTNYSKLAAFKSIHPDYECIYGVINGKTLDGEEKEFVHDGQVIKYYAGAKFLTYIFGNDKENIVAFIKSTIKACSEAPV